MRIQRILNYATEKKKANSKPQKTTKEKSKKTSVKQSKSEQIKKHLNDTISLIKKLDSAKLQCPDETNCDQKKKLSSLRAKFEAFIKMKLGELKKELSDKECTSVKRSKRSLIHAILFRFLPCLLCYATNIWCDIIHNSILKWESRFE